MPSLLPKPQKVNEIVSDINDILQKNKIYHKGNLLSVDANDFFEFPKDYVCEEKTFKEFFTGLSAAKMDSIYAYKNFPYVLDMLKNDELHFTSLEKNEQNDSSEYIETMLRCMYVQPFIASDYVGKDASVVPANPSQTINRCYFKNANGKDLQIEQNRKATYIYCFTSSYNLNKHWIEYAKDETGVCIEYSFKMPHPNKYTWLSYGRIHYDSGYDFDFIKEINLLMRRKYNKAFTPKGINKLCVMTKRDRYHWEDELRIALMNENVERPNFKEDPNAPGVLKISNGSIFSWKIKRVIAGNKIDPNNLNQLRAICSARNIPLIE